MILVPLLQRKTVYSLHRVHEYAFGCGGGGGSICYIFKISEWNLMKFGCSVNLMLNHIDVYNPNFIL
jgi:hypothetical protein